MGGEGSGEDIEPKAQLAALCLCLTILLCEINGTPPSKPTSCAWKLGQNPHPQRVGRIRTPLQAGPLGPTTGKGAILVALSACTQPAGPANAEAPLLLCRTLDDQDYQRFPVPADPGAAPAAPPKRPPWAATTAPPASPGGPIRVGPTAGPFGRTASAAARSGR